MSSERRVVRPYLGLDEAQRCLERVRIAIGGRVLEPDTRTSVPENLYLADKVEIILAEDEDTFEEFSRDLTSAVEAAGFDAAAVSLLLVLSSARLKIKDVVWATPVQELPAVRPYVTVADATDRPRALRAPFGGCTADLYVALTSPAEPAPLRPSRKGTWLARTTYKIATDLGEIGFTPIPLRDEDRERLDLHPGTVRYVEVEAATDPDLVDLGLNVYVDEGVLAELAAQANTRGAESFQMQLFLDAMTTVVYAASREMHEERAPTFTEASDSLLGRLVSQVCEQDGRVDLDAAGELWSDVKTRPARVVAMVEGWLPDFRKKLERSLGEGD